MMRRCEGVRLDERQTGVGKMGRILENGAESMPSTENPGSETMGKYMDDSSDGTEAS